MKKNIKWAVIFICVLVLLVGMWYCIGNLTQDKKIAQIKKNGKVIEEINLSNIQTSYEFDVKGDDGTVNTVRVENGKIAVVSANCKDKICVNQGYIENGILPIVCLPNELTISVISDDNVQIDAVTGR